MKIFEYENRFVKLLWLIVLLVSLGITAWVVSWNVLAYLDYEVVSQICVVYETPTEFPAVTFCDNNPFTTGLLPFDTNKDYDSLEMFLNNDWLHLGKMAASSPFYGDENRKRLVF